MRFYTYKIVLSWHNYIHSKSMRPSVLYCLGENLAFKYPISVQWKMLCRTLPFISWCTCRKVKVNASFKHSNITIIPLRNWSLFTLTSMIQLWVSKPVLWTKCITITVFLLGHLNILNFCYLCIMGWWQFDRTGASQTFWQSVSGCSIDLTLDLGFRHL